MFSPLHIPRFMPSASSSSSASAFAFSFVTRHFSSFAAATRTPASSLRSLSTARFPPSCLTVPRTNSSICHRHRSSDRLKSREIRNSFSPQPRWLTLNARAVAIEQIQAIPDPIEVSDAIKSTIPRLLTPAASNSAFPLISYSSVFPALPIGLLAGTVGAMSGIGGAVILVPAVAAFLHYDQKSAAAIGVVGSLATALTGFATYAANGFVHIPAALAICAGASLTIGIGARLASRVQNRTLQWILTFVFLGLAPLVLLGVYQKHYADHGEKAPRPLSAGEETQSRLEFLNFIPFDLAKFTYTGPSPLETDLFPYAALFAGGNTLGFLNGLLGMGGATLLTTVLSLTTDYHQLPYAAIAGTCLSSIIVPSLLGSYRHYQLGNLKTKNLPALLIGTVIGALFGAEAAIHLPEAAVRSIFASFLFLNGARSLRKLMMKQATSIKPVAFKG